MSWFACIRFRGVGHAALQPQDHLEHSARGLRPACLGPKPGCPGEACDRPTIPGPDPHAKTPAFKLPPKACDAHYATQKFHDANPKLNGAVVAALQQAIDAINSDRRKAAADYLDITKEKLGLDQLMEALADTLVEFSRAPHHVFDIASFMQRTGTIKNRAANRQEFFFEEARSLDGS